MRSSLTAKASAAAIGDWLRYWATKSPERTFIAERLPSKGIQWRRLSYAETHDRVRAIAGCRSWTRACLRKSRSQFCPTTALTMRLWH